MGLPDKNEAPKGKQDIMMPSSQNKSNDEKKKKDEEKEIESKIIIPGFNDKQDAAVKHPFIMEM